MDYNKSQVLTGLIFLAISSWCQPASVENTVVAPDNVPGTTKVSAEGVVELVTHKTDVFIIDARIRMDRRQGYIEDSISLPDIETNCQSLASIIPDKHSHSLFYCNGPKCGRSVNAIKIAMQCGYDRLYWFRGGFEEWKENDFPYIKE